MLCRKAAGKGRGAETGFVRVSSWDYLLSFYSVAGPKTHKHRAALPKRTARRTCTPKILKHPATPPQVRGRILCRYAKPYSDLELKRPNPPSQANGPMALQVRTSLFTAAALSGNRTPVPTMLSHRASHTLFRFSSVFSIQEYVFRVKKENPESNLIMCER